MCLCSGWRVLHSGSYWKHTLGRGGGAIRHTRGLSSVVQQPPDPEVNRLNGIILKRLLFSLRAGKVFPCVWGSCYHGISGLPLTQEHPRFVFLAWWHLSVIFQMQQLSSCCFTSFPYPHTTCKTLIYILHPRRHRLFHHFHTTGDCDVTFRASTAHAKIIGNIDNL